MPNAPLGYITFTSGSTTVKFQTYRQRQMLPRQIYRVVPHAQIETSGNVFYLYKKGAVRQRFIIVLQHIAGDLYDELATFWQTTIDGGQTTFVFTDENGNNHNVKWITGLDTFQQVPPDYKKWMNGEIVLAKV